MLRENRFQKGHPFSADEAISGSSGFAKDNKIIPLTYACQLP